jgi:two-component system sensor histidine kinase RegB
MLWAGAPSLWYNDVMDFLGRDLIAGFSLTEPDAVSINRAEIQWLIRLRTVATLLQALAFIPGLRLGLIAPGHYGSYFLVVGVLTLFNGLSFVWLKRRQREPSDGAVFVQLAVDLAGLTCLLNLSGGWRNPFISLYFLHAGLGALLLQRLLNVMFFALVVYSISITFYLTGFLATSAWASPLPRMTLLLAKVFVAFIIWILMSWLAVTLRKLNHNVQLLREQNSRLDRLRAIGAIAAGFSHRLATPLNTVRMRLERVARRSEASTVRHEVQIALEGVERCGDILQSYFAGRLEPDGFDLELVDVGSFVERVCRNWRFDNDEVALHIDRQRGGRMCCQISPVEFSRSLIDLLDNAREAQTGAAAHIRVTVRRVGDVAEISIDDNGPGFPDDVIARLGEPFLTSKTDGSGLGLFTAFALTHSLSGSFAVYNREGGGGRVVIRLPLSDAEYSHDSST